MRNEFIFDPSLFLSPLLWAPFYFPVIFLFVLWIPLIILGVIDLNSKRHTIVSNYPLFGRFRYVMEELRPKIYQYFIESDTDGTPINRVSRSVVYQRAKSNWTPPLLELNLIFINLAMNGLITLSPRLLLIT